MTPLRYLAIAAILALSACGVDGDPERPDGSPDLSPGIAISGVAEFGVASGR